MANKMATWLKVVVAVVAIAVVAVLVVGSQGEWFQGKLTGGGEIGTMEMDRGITDRFAAEKIATDKIITDKIITDKIEVDQVTYKVNTGNPSEGVIYRGFNDQVLVAFDIQVGTNDVFFNEIIIPVEAEQTSTQVDINLDNLGSPSLEKYNASTRRWEIVTNKFNEHGSYNGLKWFLSDKLKIKLDKNNTHSFRITVDVSSNTTRSDRYRAKVDPTGIVLTYNDGTSVPPSKMEGFGMLVGEWQEIATFSVPNTGTTRR